MNENNWEETKEYKEAVALANRILNETYADPDSDLSLLSRQFLRSIERLEAEKAKSYQEGKTAWKNKWDELEVTDAVSAGRAEERQRIIKLIEKSEKLYVSSDQFFEKDKDKAQNFASIYNQALQDLLSLLKK